MFDWQARIDSAVGEWRIVVLPPTHADGVAIARLLDAAGLACEVVHGVDALCEALLTGAGGIMISEEALLAHAPRLVACLAGQPMWSDLPVIVLSKAGRESAVLEAMLPQLGSVSVVERPMRTSTLLSLVRSNLRARGRQYQVRDILREREQLLESERGARSEAERAGRIKDEFLATLSHELRTPLNAMLGWARLLRRSPDLSEEISNGLNVIERNARSQAQIIGDLLDMSRIISGKVRLDIRSIDLTALLEATVQTVRPTAEAKGIEVSLANASADVTVSADPDRLQQVLWNLLTNAVKFTPQGGHVTVTMSCQGSTFEIAVQDDGEGIAPAFLPHIFDRFRQADASAARRHGGLGLGLSIVRQLVELHGGSVDVASGGTGKGSTFRIRLPVNGPLQQVPDRAAANDATTAPPLRPEELPSFLLEGTRVLVVDDEPDARALIERLLLECQASVDTAGSANEALQRIAARAPHVIVSDIGMPGTDGYALLRQIRALKDARRSIPAIALTAYVRSEDRANALRAGFQSHLTKPVEPAELLAAVQRLACRPAEAPAH
jgi:signal transduction histidine kinase/CheY-like chemotaxis protein